MSGGLVRRSGWVADGGTVALLLELALGFWWWVNQPNDWSEPELQSSQSSFMEQGRALPE